MDIIFILFIAVLFLAMLFCLFQLSLLSIKIWKSKKVDIPRNDAVYDFRIKVLSAYDSDVYDSMPDYDTMCDYSWIPLELKYWRDKKNSNEFPTLSDRQKLYYTIKYRFFKKFDK